MTVHSLLRTFTWSRAIAFSRVGLAGLVLFRVYSLQEAAHPLLQAVLWAFLAGAVVLVIRNHRRAGALGLLALFADTVYFLVLAAFGAGILTWLATLFYSLLLAEAIVFFGPVEVFLVVITSSGFCLISSGLSSPLPRTAIVAGAITWACSVWMHRLEATISTLKVQVLETQKARDNGLEDERQRIASDFHDGPLQNFISLQMRLEILRRLLERDVVSGMEDLCQLQSLAQTQVRELRAFLNSMRPTEIEGGNLMASARRTAEHFQKESGIPVTFLGANSPVGLPRETTAEVLQMLREALNNVQKHSGATRVAVGVDKTDRGLEVSVDDNGRGFPFSGTYSLEELELLRLGPVSLKRRARSLNADLTLESRPGRGVGLKFRIPL